MAEEAFTDFVDRERERLHGEREAIFTQQQELEGKLVAINRELTAIDAYEAVKSGRLSPPRAGCARRRRPAAAVGASKSLCSFGSIRTGLCAKTSWSGWGSRVTSQARCRFPMR